MTSLTEMQKIAAFSALACVALVVGACTGDSDGGDGSEAGSAGQTVEPNTGDNTELMTPCDFFTPAEATALIPGLVPDGFGDDDGTCAYTQPETPEFLSVLVKKNWDLSRIKLATSGSGDTWMAATEVDGAELYTEEVRQGQLKAQLAVAAGGYGIGVSVTSDPAVAVQRAVMAAQTILSKL